MTKAVVKNTSPKIGKVQNGINKKGKTPDKKKLKEAAVKTPLSIKPGTPISGKKKGKGGNKKNENAANANASKVIFHIFFI